MAIQSFKCKKTRKFYKYGVASKDGWSQCTSVVSRKLDMLTAAVDLTDLRSPPNNNLERLKGKRKGQHSIRINDQWRICFVWTDKGPEDVEICDYH